MNSELLDIMRRSANSPAPFPDGGYCPLPGLTIIRETAPSALQYAINHPLVALVMQGRKHVTMGSRSFDFGAGESLLITADVPTVSQITRASVMEPYLALVIDLDCALIESLVVEMGAAPFDGNAPVRVDATEHEVADAALRLLRLVDRPGALRVLQAQLIRELHFWLLSGRHGGAIRALGVVDSHARRIGRAVAFIRENYARVIRVEELADIAGMSPSSFHEHFRAATSLSPLQFQKQLRLIEARRQMLGDGAVISNAAYAVGYESISQFTREYGRLFGLSPARDIRSARALLQPAV